jgi:dTDP-4-dehydrorhamnose 3,5-epimerase
MKPEFFTLDKLDTYPLIKDVKIRPLVVNRDESGILVETLKQTWDDVYDDEELPFSQNYYSITEPGVARDPHQWHLHPTKQTDRFAIIKGDAVVAMADPREESPTYGQLNLFKMGEENGDNGRYLLLIPQGVLHCFLAAGDKQTVLLNYPSHVYDPEEEGRVPFKDFELADGTNFSWDLVRKELNYD